MGHAIIRQEAGRSNPSCQLLRSQWLSPKLAARSKLAVQRHAGIEAKLLTCESFIPLSSYSFGRLNLIIKKKKQSERKEENKKREKLPSCEDTASIGAVIEGSK
jgi:hypothetical protein